MVLPQTLLNIYCSPSLELAQYWFTFTPLVTLWPQRTELVRISLYLSILTFMMTVRLLLSPQNPFQSTMSWPLVTPASETEQGQDLESVMMDGSMATAEASASQQFQPSLSIHPNWGLSCKYHKEMGQLLPDLWKNIINTKTWNMFTLIMSSLIDDSCL